MVYIVTALLAEAKPLIKKYKLSPEVQSPFSIYSNENIKLIITGIGGDLALMATTFLLTKFPPTSNAILVNLGITGSIHPIGEALLAHTISSDRSGHSYYPDMRLTHPFREVVLHTVDTPIEEAGNYEAVDMEAFYVYKAALAFLSSSQIMIFKVVSDNFSANIPSKEDVFGWIDTHLEMLFKLIETAIEKKPQTLSFSPQLQIEREKVQEALQLTKAQNDQFSDALKGYLLRNHTEPLLPKHLPMKHKKEQKDAFNKLLTLLKP